MTPEVVGQSNCSSVPLKKRQAPFHIREFLCGLGAGCIETVVLFPPNKVIFRQQLHGLFIPQAIRQIRSEGVAHLYRGLGPPLMMRALSRGMMFGMYDGFQTILHCPHAPPNTSMTPCHAQAAILAGFSEAVMCPLERVQALLQTSKYHGHVKNTLHAFANLYKYSFREYYRGFSVIVARNGFSNALFFTLREPFRNSINDSGVNIPPNVLRILGDFCCGGLLGASISTLIFPMNVVKNRMQSQLGTPFDGPFKVFGVLWHERQGWRELYRGVHLNFGRSLFGWGVTNMMYEMLRRHFVSTVYN